MVHDKFLEYYAVRACNIEQHFAMAVAYFDPDGIHDLRVEIKRLRAFFRLLEKIAPKFSAKKNLRRLRKLFKAAAALRDTHVQQELTRAWMKRSGLNVSAYYNDLKQQEESARQHFAEFVEAFELQAELQKNERRIQKHLLPFSEEYAREQTNICIEQLVAQLLHSSEEHQRQASYLHQVRILTKETRYTVEIARHCFPESGYSEALVRQLRGIHQVLGKWHDNEIASAHIENFHARLSGAPRKVAIDHVDVATLDVYNEFSRQLQAEQSDLLRTFEERWMQFEHFMDENRSRKQLTPAEEMA